MLFWAGYSHIHHAVDSSDLTHMLYRLKPCLIIVDTDISPDEYLNPGNFALLPLVKLGFTHFAARSIDPEIFVKTVSKIYDVDQHTLNKEAHNMEKNDSLLLLDNEALARLLTDGDYRFTNLRFDEARAILEMKGKADTLRVFNNLELEHIMYEYLGIEDCQFPYAPVTRMVIGQDAIAFKLYITPSGTQPIVLGDERQEAKKIKNIYVYCQHVVRLK